jgi:hypothetical protein
MFPLTAVVRVPPTICVRGSDVEVIDAVAFESPVLMEMPDIDPVGNVLAEKSDSDSDSVGVASAPVRLAESVRVRISCDDSWSWATAKAASQKICMSIVNSLR